MKNGVFGDATSCDSCKNGRFGELIAPIIWAIRLLVTANVPSSPTVVTLIVEVIHSSETSVLTRATRRNTRRRHSSCPLLFMCYFVLCFAWPCCAIMCDCYLCVLPVYSQSHCHWVETHLQLKLVIQFNSIQFNSIYLHADLTAWGPIIIIIIIQFFIIYVSSQQLQGQLQTQHSTDIHNYMDTHNIKSRVNCRST
jgi:hypothetical protein